MNVVVITGSPHANGTSAYLADQFIKGAKEAGHTVHRFDAGLETIHPCFGCDHCRTSGTCIHKDGIGEIAAGFAGSPGVVFVTPLFYFSMSAQLKMVIDRFYADESSADGQ